MISVSGGAAGIVTNGIHLLDLAISIFGSEPISVISDLSSSDINPRSKDLDFWEGSSSWGFSDKRKFSINFTNLSSVKQTTEVFCLNGKIKINEDMSLDIFKRDQQEVISDNRVIRLGAATKTTDLSIKPNDEDLYLNIFTALLDEDQNLMELERELVATRAMIYGLISNRLGRKLVIGDEIEESLYNFEWDIS